MKHQINLEYYKHLHSKFSTSHLYPLFTYLPPTAHDPQANFNGCGTLTIPTAREIELSPTAVSKRLNKVVSVDLRLATVGFEAAGDKECLASLKSVEKVALKGCTKLKGSLAVTDLPEYKKRKADQEAAMLGIAEAQGAALTAQHEGGGEDGEQAEAEIAKAEQ